MKKKQTSDKWVLAPARSHGNLDKKYTGRTTKYRDGARSRSGTTPAGNLYASYKSKSGDQTTWVKKSDGPYKGVVKMSKKGGKKTKGKYL